MSHKSIPRLGPTPTRITPEILKQFSINIDKKKVEEALDKGIDVRKSFGKY
jgi:hypothetical protein